MSLKAFIRTAVLLIPLSYLAACTGMRGPDASSSVSDIITEPVSPDAAGDEELGAPDNTALIEEVEVPEAPAAPAVNPAVLALLESAHSEAGAGRVPSAMASIERALRIEPKNPVLWQELAKLKLQKGEYQQAENFAARANSWAASNKALQAENWRIISEARSLKGDNAGARAAMQRAKALEPAPIE
jgi:tetratricopeptide (TPR) repeat protein